MQKILACFVYHSISVGVKALHGGHQEAEKYSPTYRLPARAEVVSTVVDLWRSVEPSSDRSALLAFAGPMTIAVGGATASTAGAAVTALAATEAASSEMHPSNWSAATKRPRSSSSLKQNLSSPPAS